LEKAWKKAFNWKKSTDKVWDHEGVEFHQRNVNGELAAEETTILSGKEKETSPGVYDGPLNEEGTETANAATN